MNDDPRVYSKRKGAEPPPKGAVYVGRPSRWGNPFVVGKDGTQEECVDEFRHWLLGNAALSAAVRADLRGKDLVCWCAPLPCHADVLLEVANARA